MFILFGEEHFFIKNKVEEIKQKYSNYLIVNFSFLNNLEELIETINEQNLFHNNKLIFIKNFPFFYKKIDKENEKNITELIRIIENNNNNELIFIVNELSDESKINQNIFTKYLFSKNNLNIFKSPKLSTSDITNEIIRLVKNKEGSISLSNAMLLQSMLPNDLMIIDDEINKLLLLNKNITKAMIENSISKHYVDDVFGFSNAIDSNDFFAIWKKYLEKLSFETEISYLISQIINSFLLSQKIFFYLENKKTLEEIAQETNLNLYRVKKIYKVLKKFGIYKVQNIIKFLANLDFEIKTGKTLPKIGFEHFLIKFFA